MFLRDLGIGSIIFRLDELDVSPQVVRALEHANPGDGSPTNRPRAFYRALQAAGITTRAGCRKLDIIHRLGCGVRACGLAETYCHTQPFGFTPESGSFDPDKKLQAAWCRLRSKLPQRSEQAPSLKKTVPCFARSR